MATRRTASATAVAAFALVTLAACATAPTGPSVLVLPGEGKSFDQFRADDYECRQYASFQVNGSTPDDSAAQSGVKSAAVGTAVGAVAGGLMGGHRGAGTGAGVGLIAGSMAGAGAARSSQYSTQRRYDFAFQQCMYAKGHKVPVEGYAMMRQRGRGYAVPPPPPPR
jgi:YMGG-like Gly-zipper